MHSIYLSVWHRKPEGDPILTQNLISENWTPSTLTHTALVNCHAGDSSDVTLAFKDAQVIPPFSKEQTENTYDTYDTDDTGSAVYTNDTDYTDDTGDTDDIDDTDDIERKETTVSTVSCNSSYRK